MGAMADDRRPPLPDGPFLVVGLARSGVAAARTLRALGHEVRACDRGPVPAEASAELALLGVEVHGSDDGLALLEGAGCVIKSPGVPQEAPVVAAAHDLGVPVLGELELGWRLLPNPTVAVTGSNGKTTTVELLGHLHRTAGVAVQVAGNVGTALSGLVGRLDPAATVVAEASSFQLEDTTSFAPETAALLNLTPDHLDRHGTFAAYRAAKLRIFAHQRPGDAAVVPLDLLGPKSRSVTAAAGDRGGPPAAGALADDLGGEASVITFGGAGADLEDRAGALLWRGAVLIATDAIRLRGLHNRHNAMAAAAVALARGLDPAAVRAGLEDFAGVAHRLEEVARADGVVYVNDSKATNVDAATTGLRSFAGGVHVILGGHGPDGDLASLVADVADRAVAAYLIGASAERLLPVLQAAGVRTEVSGDLERAVAAARVAARPGETILLSPAYKSFDQYADYEARGEHFRALATAAAASADR